MARRPIIGITPSISEKTLPSGKVRLIEMLNAAYSDAVIKAGGVPMILPVPPEPDDVLLGELLAAVDGVLFTGGDDLNPRHYGDPAHPKTEMMHERRDRFELALFRKADALKKPVFCICLGFQVAHVGRGGALVQHIPDLELKPTTVHSLPDGSARHPVRIAPDSKLAEIVNGTQAEVNSRHHQGVDSKRQGKGLRPVAWSPDGLIEASEDMDGRYLLAVQWHPEDITDQLEQHYLFKALVEAARAEADRQTRSGR